MKWFKHMTDASDDEFIALLESKLGHFGYAAWFKLLEKIGSQMTKEKPDPVAEYPLSVWCSFLKVKQNKLSLFLELTQNKLKTKVTRFDNVLRIECPNLLKIKDNYQKDLEVSTKRLPSKEEEYRRRVQKKSTPLFIPPLRGKQKKTFPSDFSVSEKIKSWADEKGLPDPGSQLEAFRDYHESKGSKMLDWEAAFRTWLRNTKKFDRPDKKAQAKKEWEEWGNESERV